MKAVATCLSAGLMWTACASAAAPAETKVTMHMLSEAGPGAVVGTVVISESPYGVVFTPAVTGLTPGLHGFHVHENGNCGSAPKDGKTVAGLAAGGHYDPEQSKQHGLPWGSGHRGDLPGLVADASGAAHNPVLAPRLRLSELKGKSLMVHVGGDNHADHPMPLGGGGARVVCGVID